MPMHPNRFEGAEHRRYMHMQILNTCMFNIVNLQANLKGNMFQAILLPLRDMALVCTG
jgi:hypothetical protein